MPADPPFGGYSADHLRRSANYVSHTQDDVPLRRRFPWHLRRSCFDPSGMLTMSWVSHTLDALDLLERVVQEWDERGDSGCTKAIQDEVRAALSGEPEAPDDAERAS